MNPIEQLINDLSKSSRKVITVKYILDRLRLIERGDCPNCTQIAVYGMTALIGELRSIERGDQNKRA